ncbi:MAG: peptidoglycan-binding protein [Oscillospiraceae bacterium]
MDNVFKVPKNIVVHLGVPSDTNAPNVTVPFPSYIKNVASSEIYPTWPENAIRANIYAQISYTLNRIFTEFYRSRGYNFDITNSTQYDQSFVKNRDIFENIGQIVDDIFNDYIVREGNLEPLFTQYCNGTTTKCPGGMSQWGSVDLANAGYTPYKILEYYYGDNISLVTNAPVTDIRETYPGTPLKLGDASRDIKRFQMMLNTISRNYPSIPKIANPDGLFDVETENAVREFQRIFSLTVDGIVGKGTWYKIIFVFNSVMRLSELDSQGINLQDINRQFSTTLEKGARGNSVEVIQLYLNFISEFNDFIPPLKNDGIYGDATENSVKSFQKAYGLPITGAVDNETWDKLYSVYVSTLAGLPADYEPNGAFPYPGKVLRLGMSGEDVKALQTYLALISETYPVIPKITPTGYFGTETQNAVIAFQKEFGLLPRGVVGIQTWTEIANLYVALRNGDEKSFGQYPGYELSEGE